MTSLLLSSSVSSQRLSTGIKTLDAMFGDKGFYQGSTILVSGTAGSGKTSFASQFVDSVCRNGQRALYFTFEESEGQLTRNMTSIGINLKKWTDKGILKIVANRATLCGLEMHLVMAHKAVKEFKPSVVVIDPITTMIGSGAGVMDEARAMIARLLDFLKNEGITVLATDLNFVGDSGETETGISSLCDTWIRLSMEMQDYKRIRRISIIKSRGMNHGHETKDLVFTNNGLEVKNIPGVREDYK
jgi:circadian clock protein KaiC